MVCLSAGVSSQRGSVRKKLQRVAAVLICVTRRVYLHGQRVSFIRSFGRTYRGTKEYPRRGHAFRSAFFSNNEVSIIPGAY